ncbi:peptidase M56 [Bacillus cereus]|uniref:peptidase M56 n=1 Tax=Bacillus cereus TaxID=1396 RepID=UPI0039808E6F
MFYKGEIKIIWKHTYYTYYMISIISMLLLLIGCSPSHDVPSGNLQEPKGITINSKLDQLLSESMIAWNKDKYSHTEKKFETHIVYGIKNENGKIYVYLHSLMQGYNRETGTVAQAGHLLPVRATIIQNGNEFTLEDYREPTDGEEYESSLRKMFPREYANRALAISNKSIQLLETRMKGAVTVWLNEAK